MDKETLIDKARALESREDLFNLLNEIKADLLGDKSGQRRSSVAGLTED